ncbi:hypothetical protein MTO96_004782 [Rhipicephalus appendiculatus]
MMFLEPKRRNAPSQKRHCQEAWRDSAYSEDQAHATRNSALPFQGPVRPIVVGVLLLATFYALTTFGPVQTSKRGGGPAPAASNGSQVPSSDAELSPFGLTVEEEGRNEYAASRLNASVRWRQTHTMVHTCCVFADRRVRPTLVRFLVLAPTVQLVPAQYSSLYGVNGSSYGQYECLFLKRNSTPVRGTFLTESRARHQDESHVPVYRNGSARVEVCAGEHRHDNCAYPWESQVVVAPGNSVPVGGLTSAPYEPVLVTLQSGVARVPSRRKRLLVRPTQASVHRRETESLRSASACHPGSRRTAPRRSETSWSISPTTVLSGRVHFKVYVNATDERTLAFLLSLKKRSPVSLTYRSWPGVPADNNLAFAEAALVMDCVFSYANTPIEYAEFLNSTSLKLLSQPFSAEGPLSKGDMLLAQRDKLRVRLSLDPPGRTSRVFLKATRIVDADAAQDYHSLQANPITLDSDEGGRAARRSLDNVGLDDRVRVKMMFLEPKRGNAASQKRRCPEAWRDSAYSEYEAEASGPVRPIVVGILLLATFYALKTFGPVQTSKRGGGPAPAASNGSRVPSSDAELSPFGLTVEEEGRNERVALRLNASVRWRQTHSMVHTCCVFADRRVKPMLVRFLVLTPTVQLVPAQYSSLYGVNGSSYGRYECLFLKSARHLDESHVPVYRNGSARVEVCAGEHRHDNCSYTWESNVVVVPGKSVPAGGLTSVPYEPVLVTCVVPDNASISVVSLVYRSEESAFWFVPRKLQFTFTKHRATVGVCVPPWTSKDSAETQRDLLEYIAYHSALGARHFNVYVNATDEQTLAFLLSLKKRSPVSLTYRMWPGVPADNNLAFAEAALVLDCVFSYANTPIEYVTTIALREFIVLRNESTFGDFLSKPEFENATSVLLLGQTFTADGAPSKGDMLLAQRDKLRVRISLDPPGRTSRVFLKATHIVDADAAQDYNSLKANPITVDSDRAVVLRYVASPDDYSGKGENGVYMDFSNYTKNASSLEKWRTHISKSSPLLWFPWNKRTGH